MERFVQAGTPGLTSRDIASAVEHALGQTRDSEGADASRAATNGIVSVYLFGSFARGSQDPESDVDLGLLYAEAPGTRLEDQPFLLEADLSELLGRPVQCVVMNRAPADLVHRILKAQHLLLDRDPPRRIQFEVAARNRYFDLKPFLDRYRRAERVA
jgi:uncharacterized protein